jgi:hypothetical protein
MMSEGRPEGRLNTGNGSGDFESHSPQNCRDIIKSSYYSGLNITIMLSIRGIGSIGRSRLIEDGVSNDLFIMT